ncbi:hypothetical protein ACFX13_040295 [Malus domestica]|uniref:GRAM domain-containing protein n=1 Tax=Malus domestica TaxID=3750 RepID=A0A498JLV2_MALDO|nr:hypothetical protein DVH24_009212 [Malus domestica]
MQFMLKPKGGYTDYAGSSTSANKQSDSKNETTYVEEYSPRNKIQFEDSDKLAHLAPSFKERTLQARRSIHTTSFKVQKVETEDKSADQFVASSSPYMRNSYDHDSDTTPERQRQASPLSEPISPSAHSSSSSSSKTTSTLKLGHKLSETVKGKLSLGARISQKGGRANIFKQIFGISQGEELLKASQCYLSTTAGPIPGLLFISTQKLALCSETPITLPSPSAPYAAAIAGQLQLLRTHYKVQIPIRKIKTANQSEDVNKPQHKYIFTHDDFDFWFMGFLRYDEAFRNLHKALSIANHNHN